MCDFFRGLGKGQPGYFVNHFSPTGLLLLTSE